VNDAEVAQIMREYAERCVSEARLQHGATLDYSEQSLLRVDMILSAITHNDVLPLPEPHSQDDEILWHVAKSFGGYVGEVMRLHLGAEWFHKAVDGADIVQMRVGHITCSPPERAWKRLTEDPHDTIISYYRGLQHLLGRALFQPEFPKMPFWRRLFR
jgi:hypothetical protein